MANDIIGCKLNIGPVSVDLRALARKLLSAKDSNPALKTAGRFLSLFEQHGVSATQIQRFIPEVTLDRLVSDDKLLAALTDPVLAKASSLFGVKREWLEGTTESIYPLKWCYKNPKRFFADLAEVYTDSDDFYVRAFYSSAHLNWRDTSRQDMALIIVKRIASLDETDVNQYTVYGDTWTWSHAPCRVQLKAMARTTSIP